MNKIQIDLSPFCMRARKFLQQGRPDDALGLYDDVIQVDPENAMAYADRGTAYAMLKKFDLALNDLTMAFSLKYTEASAYSTAATIYFEIKKFQNALENFSKAIDLDPDYAFAYYNRSNVFHALGQRDNAISDLEKCLSLNPDENFKKLIIERLNFLKNIYSR